MTLCDHFNTACLILSGWRRSNTRSVAGVWAASQLTAATLCWAEGQAEWLPLQSIAELHEVLQRPVKAQTPGMAELTPCELPDETHAGLLSVLYCLPAGEQADVHQQPAAVTGAVVDPELAQFQAEIGAIEAETAEINRAETPPPDQQRFQDDDGTMYAWDSSLRRFVPAGEELPGTSYDPADMVYEAEDEKIPAMPAVLEVSC